jgi:hypothetical protein
MLKKLLTIRGIVRTLIFVSLTCWLGFFLPPIDAQTKGSPKVEKDTKEKTGHKYKPIFIGCNATQNITSGSTNTFIGSGCPANSPYRGRSVGMNAKLYPGRGTIRLYGKK